MRWAELSAFSDGIFRTHPGSTPEPAWQVYNDTETIDHFAKFANIHKKLADYK